MQDQEYSNGMKNGIKRGNPGCNEPLPGRNDGCGCTASDAPSAHVADSFPHVHHHSTEEKKRQITRLSRIIGHLEHVKKMIEADADCSDVLIQLSAARSALNGVGKQIISEHLTHCITAAIEDGDTQSVQDFEKAIERYL